MSRHNTTRTRSAGYGKRKNDFITIKPCAIILLTCSIVLPGYANAAEPASVKITGLIRLEDTVVCFGGNGDNWHMSWTQDERMVAGLCDGDAQPWVRPSQALQ